MTYQEFLAELGRIDGAVASLKMTSDQAFHARISVILEWYHEERRAEDGMTEPGD